VLAAFLLAAGAALGSEPLAAQQSGGMEHDSTKMMDKGKMMDKDKMMEKDKMMGSDKAMGMHDNMMFMGAAGQKAAGDYRVYSEDGKQELELSDHFSVAPAPDLYLVLSTGSEAMDGSLYLGKLKRAAGAQSYKLPGGKDLTKYTTLLVWSKKEKRAVASAEWHPSAGGKMMDKM